MSKALICDRCGSTGSNRGLFSRQNWTVKYKSVHSPSTFIGSRNRTFDLCTDCRREMDKFLGFGTDVHEVESSDTDKEMNK